MVFDFSALIPHIAYSLLTKPWALDPELYRVMVAAAKNADATAAAMPGVRAKRERRKRSSIEIIPVYGIVTDHAYDFFEYMGMSTSGESIVAAVKDALADGDVDAIVMDVRSPGGMVAGTVEAATELASIRDEAAKPIVAVSNYMMASAAYWLAAAASHELVASPSSITGSIGVIAYHVDASGFYEAMGLNVELITAGKYKAEGNDLEPMSDEARDFVQSSVDYTYGLFVAGVANARNATSKEVMNGFGEGRALDAEPAKSANLVDRVASFGETISRLESPQARAAVRRRTSAEQPDGGTKQEPESPIEATEKPITTLDLANAVRNALEETDGSGRKGPG